MCKILNLVVVEVELDAKIVYDWITKEYNYSLIYFMVLLYWIAEP